MKNYTIFSLIIILLLSFASTDCVLRRRKITPNSDKPQITTPVSVLPQPFDRSFKAQLWRAKQKHDKKVIVALTHPDYLQAHGQEAQRRTELVETVLTHLD